MGQIVSPEKSVFKFVTRRRVITQKEDHFTTELLTPDLYLEARSQFGSVSLQNDSTNASLQAPGNSHCS
jgi:hypothetical protein